MQRIARLSRQYDNAALDGYADLHKVLRRTLPPSTVNLYASPKVLSGGIVEWYSDLSGQPTPLSQLDTTNPSQAAAVRRLLTERLAGIRHAAAQLIAQADNPAHGERLRALLQQAVSPPEDKNVYVINGQPVITAWGVDTPTPVAAPSPDPAHLPRPRRVWPWLLLLLLSGGALFGWLHTREPDAPPPIIEVPPEPAPEPKPAPPPPDPVEVLRQRIRDAGKNCDALKSLQAEPLLKSHADLREELTQQRLKYCKDQMISEAKTLCPGERLPELAPEMVLVMDTTGSMDSLPPYNKNGPTFLAAIRQTAAKIVAQLPSDTSAGLVLMDQCPAARPAGFFPPTRRSQLLRQIENAQGSGGSTPMANAIRQAANMLDGVNRESVILMVIDDGDTCDGNPCAAARELAQRKPHLKINVVDVLGTGTGNCLAAATGGKVFNASNIKTLRSSTQQGLQDVMLPAHCVP